jgi:nitrogen-specific signal transduction histidine kinase/CheY-like chemotaxis protein
MKKVLIVDDNAGMREAVRWALEAAENPYLLLEAANQLQALRILHENRDLLAVFVDQEIDNDERGGLRILQKIVEAQPLLPVILYTAVLTDVVRREAFDKGALWCLPKLNIQNKDELAGILRSASKFVEVMPIEADPRFLKQILDAVPVEIMVRDRAGVVRWQNREKEKEFGPIDYGGKFCWHVYENCKNEADDRCRWADEECACEPVLSTQQKAPLTEPVYRIHRYRGDWTGTDGRYHPPAHLHLAANGILGRDGQAEFAVETSRDITTEIEMLQLFTGIAEEQPNGEMAVLRLVSESLAGKIGFSRSRIWLLNDSSAQGSVSVTCVAESGKHQGQIRGERIVRPIEVLLEKSKHGESIIVTKEDVLGVAKPMLGEKLQPPDQVLWAPLCVGEDLVGLIAVDKRGRPIEKISQVDEYWLSFLSRHVSAVVSQIRAIRELEEGRRNLEWLRSLDRRISAIDSPEVVLKTVIEELKRKFAVDLVQFHLYRSQDELICLAADDGQHTPDCPIRFGYKASIGVNAQACRTGEAIFVNNTESDPIYAAHYAEYRRTLANGWGERCQGCRLDLKAMACLPIREGEKVLGSMCLGYVTNHNFSTSEKAVLNSVSDSLSLTLKTVRQLTAAQYQAMETRRVRGLQVLARGLTHSLQSIAQRIRQRADGLSACSEDPSSVRECGKDINHEVKNLRVVFEALGRHSADHSGSLFARVHEMIRDLVVLQEHRFKNHKITLEASLHPSCEDMCVDQSKLLVILLTLLENSFNAFDQIAETAVPGVQRKVTISTMSVSKKSFAIMVADNGKGMSEELKNTVFRLPDVDISGKPATHRIGLPISRMLAETMGGSVKLASTLGRGTEVTVTLASEELEHGE